MRYLVLLEVTDVPKQGHMPHYWNAVFPRCTIGSHGFPSFIISTEPEFIPHQIPDRSLVTVETFTICKIRSVNSFNDSVIHSIFCELI